MIIRREALIKGNLNMQKYDINYLDVKKMYNEQGLTFKEISLKYGCSRTVIRKIARRHKIISIRGKNKLRKILIQKSKIPLSLNRIGFTE